ncbi:MAG: hypothetical protein ACNA7V_14255 [Bacteroidales bacterium]
MCKPFFGPATLLIIFTLIGCNEKEELRPPVIHFKTGGEYTSNGDTVAIGRRLFFGIQARSDESVLTNFTVKKKLADGALVTMMDTALYAEYMDIDKSFFQNVEPEAIWLFTVMDRNRMTAQISLVIYKDPDSQFGGIHHIQGIKLGYQNNPEFGSFLIPATGEVLKTDSAYLFQDNIDILCYFKNDDVPPGPVLSSPGEMDNFSTDAQNFYPTIIDWAVRNYTLWDISVDGSPVSVQDFDASQNDSLLIVSYNAAWGRKKFKWATSGKVIPFQTSGGKLGLVKIIHNDNSDDGFIELDLKIQQ